VQGRSALPHGIARSAMRKCAVFQHFWHLRHDAMIAISKDSDQR